MLFFSDLDVYIRVVLFGEGQVLVSCLAEIKFLVTLWLEELEVYQALVDLTLHDDGVVTE